MLCRNKLRRGSHPSVQAKVGPAAACLCGRRSAGPPLLGDGDVALKLEVSSCVLLWAWLEQQRDLGGLVIIVGRNDRTDGRRCRVSSAARGGFGWSVLRHGNGVGMAGAGNRLNRHDACVLHGCSAAAYADRARRTGRAARSGALGEGRGLHGRWSRPRGRTTGILLRAVGGRGQSGRVTAGPLPGAQPGGGADRAQADNSATSQRLPGDRARATVRPGDQVQCRG